MSKDWQRRADAKTRGRWGEGLRGQRLPGYRIVVTEQRRRGISKRHTFILDEDSWDEPGGPHWMREPDDGLLKEHYRARATGQGMRWSQPLPPTVDLSRGVSVTAPVLTLILEALVSDGRHNIDIASVKVIVSQLGPRLTAFDTLDDGHRRLAEPALYKEVLARCTTL